MQRTGRARGLRLSGCSETAEPQPFHPESSESITPGGLGSGLGSGAGALAPLAAARDRDDILSVDLLVVARRQALSQRHEAVEQAAWSVRRQRNCPYLSAAEVEPQEEPPLSAASGA